MIWTIVEIVAAPRVVVVTVLVAVTKAAAVAIAVNELMLRFGVSSEAVWARGHCSKVGEKKVSLRVEAPPMPTSDAGSGELGRTSVRKWSEVSEKVCGTTAPHV